MSIPSSNVHHDIDPSSKGRILPRPMSCLFALSVLLLLGTTVTSPLFYCEAFAGQQVVVGNTNPLSNGHVGLHHTRRNHHKYENNPHLSFLQPPPRTSAAFTTTVSLSAVAKMVGDFPEDVVQYSTVPKPEGTYFESDSIPKGLLKDHTTKEGTWGIIRVHRGKLEYTIQQGEEEDPTTAAKVVELNPDLAGVIVPLVKHHVRALTDDVQFVVEFYRRPGTGPVNEQREGL